MSLEKISKWEYYTHKNLKNIVQNVITSHHIAGLATIICGLDSYSSLLTSLSPSILSQ